MSDKCPACGGTGKNPRLGSLYVVSRKTMTGFWKTR